MNKKETSSNLNTEILDVSISQNTQISLNPTNTIIFVADKIVVSDNSLCLKIDSAPIDFEKAEKLIFKIGNKKYTFIKTESEK